VRTRRCSCSCLRPCNCILLLIQYVDPRRRADFTPVSRLSTEKAGEDCVLWSLLPGGPHILTNDMALRATSLNAPPVSDFVIPITWPTPYLEQRRSLLCISLFKSHCVIRLTASTIALVPIIRPKTASLCFKSCCVLRVGQTVLDFSRKGTFFIYDAPCAPKICRLARFAPAHYFSGPVIGGRGFRHSRGKEPGG
jgi:hypothetical protein